GLDDDGGEVCRTDLLLDHRDRLGRGLGSTQSAVPKRVRHRRAVDLGRERSEAALVWHALRSERHGEVGAAVIGVIESDHRLLAGVAARDLHGVLHRLGARVEQGAALLVVAGRQPIEGLRDLDVGVVGRDGEAGVGELPEPRSMSELPSTSTSTPPPAAAAKTGMAWPTPEATAWLLRLASSTDFGPGMDVTSLRSCGSDGPPRGVVVVVSETIVMAVIVGIAAQPPYIHCVQAGPRSGRAV